ncbi:hypothetical protein BWK63_00560 [Flavobacterium covae]|nr:hypothetical protein AWN65_09060 [Flavobacterium covae]OWP82543.1 hypothetical protein BWK63_00560 [Flavobacterium covae]POR21462.1 hypothetical protein BWK57_09895 [Flavobacterium columnare]
MDNYDNGKKENKFLNIHKAVVKFIQFYFYVERKNKFLKTYKKWHLYFVLKMLYKCHNFI